MTNAYETDSSEEIEIDDDKRIYICYSCKIENKIPCDQECYVDNYSNDDCIGYHKNCEEKVDKHYTKYTMTDWPYTDTYNFCGLFCRKDNGKGSEEHYRKSELSEAYINDWEIDKGYSFSGEKITYFSAGKYSPNDEVKQSDLILCETCGEKIARYYHYKTIKIKKKELKKKK